MAVLLEDGRVLVAGGVGNTFPDDSLLTSVIYDPDTDTWTAAGSCVMMRRSATAVRLDDGRVLMAGGRRYYRQDGDDRLHRVSVAATELFDPVTETWTPGPGLPQGREHHSLIKLTDGSVLIAGGYHLEDSTITDTLSCYRFVPETNTWVPAGSLPRRRTKHTAHLLSDGRVLLAGGVGDRDRSEPFEARMRNEGIVYDPTDDSWTETGRLRVGRYLHTGCVLQDGRVLVVGGHNDYASV